MNRSDIRKLVSGAMFAALICLATMLIRVPSLGPGGYVNIGDTFVLLSAWMLGGGYGALAAGVGSAMADLMAGYAIYVPGTFAIKFLMALAAYGLLRIMADHKLPSMPSHLISAIAAEAIMVCGYFIYEALFLGYGLAAAPAVISNIFQGITNMAISLVMLMALNANNYVSRAAGLRQH